MARGGRIVKVDAHKMQQAIATIAEVLEPYGIAEGDLAEIEAALKSCITVGAGGLDRMNFAELKETRLSAAHYIAKRSLTVKQVSDVLKIYLA